MSAEVTEIHRYQAYCLDCDWWGEQVESDWAAEDEADEHDAEHHGGAS